MTIRWKEDRPPYDVLASDLALIPIPKETP